MSDAAPQGAATRYARVIVEVAPDHLDRPFDYRVPDGAAVAVGQRVRVGFAGRRVTGWVVDVGDTTDTDASKVKELDAVVGNHTWFDAEDLDVWRWVADRWAAPLAAVLRHALCDRIAAVESEAASWPAPRPVVPADSPPCPSHAWRRYNASALLRAVAGGGAPVAAWLRVAPDDDPADLTADLVARCLASGRSALVLAADPASPVPDAALAVAGDEGADLRADPDASAGARNRQRYRAFLRARTGRARVVVGERGAVFAPARDLGLIVVADEANPAYKERRAPRFHARDVALGRARFAGASAVLLGELCSAGLRRVVSAGHVATIAPDRAAERDAAPVVEVVDLADPRPGARRARFSELAHRRMAEAIAADGAVLVLAARGGQGAALACRACGDRRECPTCTASVRAARKGDVNPDGWLCPTCAWAGQPFPCARCGGEDTVPLAAGAGRLAQELSRSFPQADVVRMEGFDAPGPTGRPAIAVMTRGSVVARPKWLDNQRALVVAPDLDALLNRPAVDAAEDALRLCLAVGRVASRIVVQTRDAQHPAVQALVRWDPDGWWEREEPRRAELGWPPATRLIRVDAPAARGAEVAATLQDALGGLATVLGPDQSGASLVKTTDMHGTLSALRPLRYAWAKEAARVRIDVDPDVAG